MAALLPNETENARKIGAKILQTLAEVGQNEVAKALETSDSTISRLKGDVSMFAGMLVKLGYKVVPAEMRCYDERTLASILQLAQQRMAQLQTPSQLAQDWDAE